MPLMTSRRGLAPRMTIRAEVRAGRGTPHGGVFLDIASRRTPEEIKKKLPSMYHQFKQLADIDITKEPMEVGPTTHYAMGGIRVDAETQMSTVPGLFAAGECAAGLHGANRLGGNSLSDLLVFGKRAGEHAARFGDRWSGLMLWWKPMHAPDVDRLKELIAAGVTALIFVLLFARPAHLVSPAFLGMLRDFFRFNREAKALIGMDGAAPSLGDWLDQKGFSRLFVERLIVPQASAVWSADPQQMWDSRGWITRKPAAVSNSTGSAVIF